MVAHWKAGRSGDQGQSRVYVTLSLKNNTNEQTEYPKTTVTTITTTTTKLVVKVL